MTCQLCGCKPSWCECTPADYAAAEMAETHEDTLTEVKKLSRMVALLAKSLTDPTYRHSTADFDFINQFMDENLGSD
jgi:hypothetical protein